MLNKEGIRELAYLVKIDDIFPIVGSDNCEAAMVGGWSVMVRKGTFNKGDLAIYFEVDSKVDVTKSEFAFLEKKHGVIKTQKYTFGGKGLMISQGLLMSPKDFNWTIEEDCVIINHKERHCYNDDSRFLTTILRVTYASKEDTKRKAASDTRYTKMKQRHPELFKKGWVKWLMKREWGRKLLFVFFGKKRDKKGEFPHWVKKTDEERIENMIWKLKDKTPLVATEKIDGTSTTFTLRKEGLFGKRKFYVCSRNVCFDKPDKQCFYETNVYTEMAQKYNVEKVLNELMDIYPDEEWITLQGETFGAGIQKRDYTQKSHGFMGFNLITSKKGRLGTVESADIMYRYGIPWVPILTANFVLPDSIEELREHIDSCGSLIDGKMREGIVFRSQDGQFSFKCVSPEFIIKYHG